MEPDVILVLDAKDEDDAKPIEIHAWHQVLANASPVFRAMLAPDRFAEGTALQKDKHLRVPLPETNASAMEIVSDILHLRSSKVPTTDMTLDRLLEIAVVVDKFECVEAVQPWFRIWKEFWSVKNAVEAVYSVEISMLAKWVFICQALGAHEDSRRHLDRLKNCLCAEDIEQHNTDMHIDLLPSSLLDDVRARRLAIAVQFQEIIIAMSDSIAKNELCQIYNANRRGSEVYGLSAPEDVYHCSSINLGNLLIATRDAFGSDWRANIWTGSVYEMYQTMNTIANRLTGTSLVRSGGRNSLNHARCSVDDVLRDKIKAVM